MIAFFIAYVKTALTYAPIKMSYGIMLAFAVYMLAFKLFRGDSSYD